MQAKISPRRPAARVVKEAKSPRIAKIREWLIRYVPSEIAGTLTAYLGYYYVIMVSANHTAAAFAAAMSENIGFYAIFFCREVLRKRRLALAEQRSLAVSDLVFVTTGLLVEFGPSELLDSFFIRPFTIALGTHFLGMEWGVILGKLAADVTFFVPAILLYEYKKSFLSKRVIKP